MDNLKLLIIAFFTGFVGDFLLQYFTNKGLIKDFLNGYFKQHGPAESMTIAGGMMTLFFIIIILSGLPINYLTLTIYGILLDFIFRELMIFQSLTGYYNYLDYFWSAFWGAIPMIIPYFIYKFTNLQIYKFTNFKV